MKPTLTQCHDGAPFAFAAGRRFSHDFHADNSNSMTRAGIEPAAYGLKAPNNTDPTVAYLREAA